MENLIRIKLNPKRGGSTDIDFKRPCFRIYDWMNSDVEIWYSDDNGSSWSKLGSDKYRYSYDFDLKQLYVSLEFNITTISQLAFYAIEGNNVGIGHELARYNRIQLGWTIEGQSIGLCPVGNVTGSDNLSQVGTGHGVLGSKGINFPLGYNNKTALARSVQCGFTTADPEDSIIPLGFHAGQMEIYSGGTGVWILGMGEYQVNFLSLDDDTINNLCSDAVWHKQKNVTLDGTDPEDLD